MRGIYCSLLVAILAAILVSSATALTIRPITPASAPGVYQTAPITPPVSSPASIKKQQEIAGLLKQVEEKQSELIGVNNQVENSSREIISSHQRLRQAENELNQQQTLLNGRIRAIYKNNAYNNLIALLVTSTSFSDLWSRVSYLARVNQVDQGILQENRRSLEKVDAVKKELADRKNDQLASRRLRITELADLRRELSLKQVELARLENQVSQAKTVPQSSTAGLPISILSR